MGLLEKIELGEEKLDRTGSIVVAQCSECYLIPKEPPLKCDLQEMYMMLHEALIETFSLEE
ncbi:hypothetical protein GBA52_020830 [Prunus armeniaca]|nr:hypothetical protein GBA52_020830 [Prunus armeniaca]